MFVHSPLKVIRYADIQRLVVQVRENINEVWKPDVVAISGDVGWKGKTEDYVIAEEWIEKLKEVLNLTSDKVIISPGNHV